ncbi:MAG: phosphatase PAP2 family protein [Bacteroidia bacterium]
MQKTPAQYLPLAMRSYLLVLASGILFFGGATLFLGYEESFSWLNSLHTPLGDVLMPHLTHLGQGIIVAGLVVWLIGRKDPAWALTCLLTLIILIPLIGLLKTQAFDDWDRPLRLLGEENIHFIGLRRLTANAFPSGHSAGAAASLMFLLPLITKRAYIMGAILGLVALIASYSRIYIGVHFPGDVAAGLFIGGLISFIGIKFLYPFLQKHQSRLQYPIILKWLGIFVLGAGIVSLVNTYYLDGLDRLDKQLFLMLNGWNAAWADPIMKYLSATKPWLWVPAALLIAGYMKGGWKMALQVGIALALAVIFADRVSAGIFKPWIERYRPCQPEAGLGELVRIVSSCGGKYGFVSSHSANFFAVAAMTFLAFPKRWVAISMYGLAAAVAYSRIYLGVHYPGDVLAGAVVGIMCGYAAWWIPEQLDLFKIKL